jgi:hypothetical protein
MEVNLLLRLVIAHLLTDFVLQPKSWVKDREEKQGRSTKLYLHVSVTTLVAYLLSGQYTNWVIPVVIFSTHLLIDYVKSKKNTESFSYFIADQFAHLFVIVVLWAAIERNGSSFHDAIAYVLDSNQFWTVAAGYVFVSWPLGIIIGKATKKWRDQITKEKQDIQPNNEDIKTGEEQELGLASAGKWIGICERILILTFVLMGQYTAIGFLMTAKSILRFSEKEANTQLKTEYVLVGTLVSFATSAMIGVLINLALNH